MSDITPAFRLQTPALNRDVVTEKHARVCRESGHMTHKVDGVDQGWCPRCGAVTETPAPAATYRVVSRTPSLAEHDGLELPTYPSVKTGTFPVWASIDPPRMWELETIRAREELDVVAVIAGQDGNVLGYVVREEPAADAGHPSSWPSWRLEQATVESTSRDLALLSATIPGLTHSTTFAGVTIRARNGEVLSTEPEAGR